MDVTQAPAAEIIGPYLRKRGDLIAYWCMGCDRPHSLNLCVADRKDGAPAWEFDGASAKPSFHPSVHVIIPADGARPRRSLCHSWVKGGRIQYLPDSHGHQLRGWHDMVAFPEGYGGWS